MRRFTTVAVLGLGGLLTAAGVGGQAQAQVPVAEADYGGFATGTVLHADALQSGATRVVGVEVAQSNAAVDSQGLTLTLSELGRRISPADDQQAYGRGVGLELGLGVDQPEDNQVQLAGVAEAFAPPPTDLVTEQIEVPAAPLAYSSTVRGQARARYLPDTCLFGADLGYGLGFVEDLQLVDTGEQEGEQLGAPLVATDASGPTRAVSQSVSRTRLVPQTAADGTVLGPNFGLMSETRQTIAPVTLFEGTPGQITFEFLGEWVLRATATGLPGSARIHYGPGTVSPQTPILRVIDAEGAVRDILTFQQIFTDEGVSIGEVVVIGEDPRAIGGDSTTAPAINADGTSAAAAVDVLRIQVPPAAPEAHAVDLRVGHMEVSATVPAGGIICPTDLPVSKTSNPEVVQPGDEFTYTITVPAIPNPHECTLVDVRVVDLIEVIDGDIDFTIVSSNPAADTTTADTLTFNDIGPIGPGEQRTIDIVVRIEEGSTAGRLQNTVNVTANCPVQPADGGTDVVVPLTGEVVVQVPEVTTDVEVLPSGPTEPLARTGSRDAVLGALGGALLLGAIALRRFLGRTVGA